jgi:cytoskeleton protein RodZ
MRARIDVSEIEAQTKIRAKYLRALENEEWSLLPGPTFVKSFLRTYAQALDLDGKALVEEYRLHHERPSEAALEPIVSTPQSARGRQGGRSSEGPSRAYMAAVGVVGAVIVLLVVLLLVGGGGRGGSSTPTTNTPSHTAATHHHAGSTHHATNTGGRASGPPSSIVALSLKPTAALYVCLIGDNARKLIPGLELQPGHSTPTFHARHFVVNLGNNSLTMYIDGRARTVPSSSGPIGYSITRARGRQPLPAGQLPTCK